MNNVTLIGRLCKEVDCKYSQGEKPTAIARYTLAVDRKYKKDGQPTADFINCVALGKPGEFAEKYLKKGMKIAVTGHIQTGSYLNKEGVKVFTTDVIIDTHEFCENKNTSNGDMPSMPGDNSFMSIPDGIDDLPFN